MIPGDPPADRVDALVRDVEAIPGVLDRLADGEWAAIARAAVGAPRAAFTGRLLLTGLGSSRFAALVVAGQLAAEGLPVAVEPASADRPAPLGEGDLCIAISSSGRTPETVAAALRLKGRARLVAVTRDAGSPLAGAADAVIALPVAAEASGVATTSFAATLGVLLHLVAAIAGRPSAVPVLRAGSRGAATVLATRASWLPPALAAIEGVERIPVLAPWSEQGQAEQIALLFREAPRRDASAFETAEWLHVGVYTALPNDAVVLLPGSPADAEVVQAVTRRGGRVVVAGDPSGLDGSIAAAIPSEGPLDRAVGPALLASELWRRVSGG